MSSVARLSSSLFAMSAVLTVLSAASQESPEQMSEAKRSVAHSGIDGGASARPHAVAQNYHIPPVLEPHAVAQSPQSPVVRGGALIGAYFKAKARFFAEGQLDSALCVAYGRGEPKPLRALERACRRLFAGRGFLAAPQLSP